MTNTSGPMTAEELQSGAFTHREALRHQWHGVALAREVDTEPVQVSLLGREYVLWRTPDGSISAAPNGCPHRNARLSEGSIRGDGCLACPYHGWAFDPQGRCVDIPSSGPDARIPPKAHLAVTNCEVRYGLVWLCPGEPVGTLPAIPQEDDPAFRRINNPVQVWRTATTRMVDNFLDISHFSYVHRGTFGATVDPLVPPIEVTELPDGYTGYAYEARVGNPSVAAAGVTGQTEPEVDRWMTSGFHLPFTVRSTVRYADGLEHILLLVSTPIDDVTSYFTFVVWRNDDFRVSAEDIIQFDRRIGVEDRTMLETVPGSLPLGNEGVVSVQSDRCSVEWKRRLVQMLES